MTDITERTAPIDQVASQLVTLTNGHSTRITTLEDAGYVTQSSLTSTLSTYALQSALGTTNTTVDSIDTRLTTVENAGYVTTSGLTGYSYATEGYVQSNLPTATDILTDTSVTTSANSGTTAGVAVTNTTNGVNLAFTVPNGTNGTDGTDGTTPTISVGSVSTGDAGTNASVSASTSGTNTAFSFTIPRGATGATGATGSVSTTISKTAHSAGANDRHFELYSPNSGSANNEVSLRFHQAGIYWGQIRFRNSQFYFTEGSSDSRYAINTGAINASGTLTARLYPPQAL